MDNEQQPVGQAFEPLSEREREILALLAEKMSDREIADRLVLAYTTVKWYNQQIFNKLGVENRRQAVNRATALGILARMEAVHAPIHNLPTQLTPFIGRVGELAELNYLLRQSNTRLVTILAPGGMGKTRLALAGAEHALRQFAQGVFFIPLASVPSIEHLVPAIAEELGLRLFPDNRPPKLQLMVFLQTRQMLLILDNFEHLLEGASLIADLLQAPQIKVIVTSRERLHLDGEIVYRLGGLPYPEQTSDNPLSYEGVQLFLELARRTSPRDVNSDIASIARICRFVQGMPLAIELAAAWVGTLSPAEIGDEILHSTDFLYTTMRNAPERLRSIRAVFEATWRRLTPDEQGAFRRLSLFRGGCTREAAHVVAGAELGTLAALVDKALLIHRPEKKRYEIHELLRQYATEQLEAAREAELIRNAYRDYFGKLAQQWGKALKTPKQLQALAVLEADFDNLRQAFQEAIGTGNPDVIEPFTDLWYFYEMGARNIEGSETFTAAIDALRGQESITLGKLLVGQAIFHERFHQYQQERRLAQASLELLQRLGAEREALFSMTALGVGLNGCGDIEGSAILWREALELAQHYDDPWVLAILHTCLAGIAYDKGDSDEARRLYAQAYTLMTKQKNYWGSSFVLNYLAYLALEDGDYGEAERLFESGLANAQKVHHLNNVSAALNGLRQVALKMGDVLQAARHAEKMLAINRDIGDRYGVFLGTLGLAEIATTSGNAADARKHLREALMMSSELDDPSCILNLGIVAVPFLIQTTATTQAVLLMSFLRSSPLWNTLIKFEREKLQRHETQLQVDFPSDTYIAAWKAGQNTSVSDLLVLLHTVV